MIMAKSVLIWLVLVTIFASLPLVSAEQIVGNSIVEENAFSKISATPHTTLCLPGIECTQYIDITNKTASGYDDLYLAWVFNYELTKGNGKLELWKPSVFGWVEHSRTCESDYSYELNKYPGERNPHEASCDYTSKIGNPQTWVQKFKTGDAPTKTIYYDAWQVVSGNKWIDVTSHISKANKGNQFAYYTDSPFSMDAGETLKLRLSYVPSLADDSKKWDLYYYRGASATCLINNTCSYVQKLDPWFDTDFSWKRQFTMTGAGDYNVLRFDFNATSFGAFGNLFDSSVQDGNAVMFTNCAEDTQLFHNKRSWVDSTSAVFDINTGAAATETCIYMYYGNDTNTLDQSRPSDVYDIWDDFEDGDYTGGPAVWVVQEGTWSAATGALQWQSGNDDDDISVNFGSSFDYSEGFLHDANFIVCSNCELGINTDSSNDEGTSDGYETSIAIGSGTKFGIQIRNNGANSAVGTTNTATNDANESTLLTRDSSGTFRINKDFETLPINQGVDTNFSAAQYLVLSHFTAPNQDGINSVYFTFHYNADSTFSVGAEEDQIAASFTSSGSRALDPPTKTSTILTFTNTSVPIGTSNFTWFVDDVNLSSDVNFLHEFTSAGDFNVFLAMDTAGTHNSAQETVTISTVVSNIDINFSYNSFTVEQADVNYGVIFDGNGTSFNWGFPQDNNITTRNAQKTYTSSGEKEVCVTITTGDANKTTCENFFVGRVIVRIPLDITTLDELSPFDLEASAFPVQTYTGLTADSNVFVFNNSTNFDSIIGIDFNSEYFPTSRIFTFNSFLFDYQPYLVPVTGNLASTIFTIDNINQKQTIPGIKIVSETVIGGDLIIVESKESDITGTAEFHFEIGRAYTLSFLDSNNSLIFSGTLNAKDADSTLFAALAQQELFSEASPTSSFNLGWIPIVSQVNPGSDGNVTISNIINPFNTVIGDVNVFVSHLDDSNVIFQTVFTLDSSDQNQSFTYDINVAGFNSDFPLKVNIQVFDVNGLQIANIYSKNYSFKTTMVMGAFEILKQELGAFPVMFFSIIICAALIGLITLFSPTTNNNWVGVIAMVTTAFFVIITWIPLEAWLVSGAMSVGMILWRDIEQ